MASSCALHFGCSCSSSLKWLQTRSKHVTVQQSSRLDIHHARLQHSTRVRSTQQGLCCWTVIHQCQLTTLSYSHTKNVFAIMYDLSTFLTKITDVLSALSTEKTDGCCLLCGLHTFLQEGVLQSGILGERSGLLWKCGVAGGRDLPMESAQDHAARWRPCCAAVQGHCLFCSWILVDLSQLLILMELSNPETFT